MRRSALIVAAIVLASSVGALAAAAALHDPADAASAERQPTSQPNLEATLGYFEGCHADGLTVDRTDAAFDATGVFIDELSCCPDGRYPDLGNDYGHPPR